MRRALAALALLLAASAGAEAQTQAQPPAARPEIGKPVIEAQSLVRQRNYAAALVALGKADAVKDKSPYETYIIEETRAAAAMGTGDYAGAATAIEAVLATHILPQADAEKRLVTLTELDYQRKDYAKTVADAARYYQAGGGDPEPRRLMATAYYFEQDYADAARTLRAVLDDAARAGKPPDEQLLLALASSEFHVGDQAGYRDALMRLAAADPKPSYWRDLCRAVRAEPGFAPRLELDLDRVCIPPGGFDNPTQFMQAAELALTSGFPGDAQSFLARGYASGMLGKGAGAAREQHLAALAKQQSADDVKDLAAQAKEAAAAPDGRKLEQLGEAYASYGRWRDAANALEKSLAKGGLADAADARLHLGVAYLMLHDARARPLLQSIAGRDGTGDIARLWLIAGRD